jgi:hypothetical protein
MVSRSLPGIVAFVLVTGIAGAHPPAFLTTFQGHALGPYAEGSFPPDASLATSNTVAAGHSAISRTVPSWTRDFVSLWAESGYPCYHVLSSCGLEFTGGRWWEEHSGGWLATGGLAYRYDFREPAGDMPGHFADMIGDLWVDSQAPVQPTSWGRLKALYR